MNGPERREYRAQRGVRVLCALAVLVAAGCARTAREPPRPRPLPERPAGRFVQEGLASYYANSLAGNRTASGDRYDPRKLTAAHRTLPLGTRLSVTRVDGRGRVVAGPVTVRVNDRGPFSGRRIIDLSHEVARRLDMLRDGVVRVRLESVP